MRKFMVLLLMMTTVVGCSSVKAVPFGGIASSDIANDNATIQVAVSESVGNIEAVVLDQPTEKVRAYRDTLPEKGNVLYLSGVSRVETRINVRANGIWAVSKDDAGQTKVAFSIWINGNLIPTDQVDNTKGPDQAGGVSYVIRSAQFVPVGDDTQDDGHSTVAAEAPKTPAQKFGQMDASQLAAALTVVQNDLQGFKESVQYWENLLREQEALTNLTTGAQMARVELTNVSRQSITGSQQNIKRLEEEKLFIENRLKELQPTGSSAAPTPNNYEAYAIGVSEKPLQKGDGTTLEGYWLKNSIGMYVFILEGGIQRPPVDANAVFDHNGQKVKGRWAIENDSLAFLLLPQ